jgi:hypothetical protein
VDVGFENPVFACIESNYDAAPEVFDSEGRPLPSKSLTFYELDLVITSMTPLPSSSHSPFRINFVTQ